MSNIRKPHPLSHDEDKKVDGSAEPVPSDVPVIADNVSTEEPGVPEAPPPIELQRSPNHILSGLEKLPAELMGGGIFSLLSYSDSVALSRVSKEMHGALKIKVRVNTLLQLVAQGRQTEAEELIRENPDILLKKGSVTDGSGRTFEGITALQYAIWAWDSSMWEMILRNFPNDDEAVTRQILQSQSDETDYVQKHGKNYDPAPLLAAYTLYLRNADHWSDEERRDCWIKQVGGEQRNVPAYIAQEICCKDRPLSPVPAFNDSDAPRDLTFKNAITNSIESYFPLKEGEGLGFEFAILRHAIASKKEDKVYGRKCPSSLVPRIEVLQNYNALSHLFEVKREMLQSLKDRFQCFPDNSLRQTP